MNRVMTSEKSVYNVGKKTVPERFDVLAKQKGWTEEQLRQSYDLPRVSLPPGTPLVRLPSDLMEDPFKSSPPSNAEYEFQHAETLFYAKLKRTSLVSPGDNVSKSSMPREENRSQPRNTAPQGNRSRLSTQNRKAIGSKQGSKK